MSAEPCSVCGGTDLNLVDGFYYCSECGTQDTNVRETVVEQTVLADGTFAHVATRKIITVLKDGIEMSPDWYKWHAFNFILCGLVEELIALGAKPSVKMKVLWIWVRYIKTFQEKEDLGISEFQDKESNNKENRNEGNNSRSSSRSRIFFEEDLDESIIENVNDGIDKDADTLEDPNEETPRNKRNKKIKKDRYTKDVNVVTKGVLLGILYVALNLDRSEIQLSHLCRFIREGRLSIVHSKKFIPKELNVKAIPHWNSFKNCTNEYTPNCIRTIAMTLFKRLDLGMPLVPDLRKMVDNYVTELCLPIEFKNLVFALMNMFPCDYLDIGSKGKKATAGIVRLPDYETVIMSYVLVALKICFGLDDEYEIQLSDAVEKINEEENYEKSHKLGRYSNETNRLFSFREWCNFLQFRKIMLCKFYLPMAQQHRLDIDDHVFMEQLEDRPRGMNNLRDEVTLDILNKIPLENNVGVIPTTEFAPTLTPRTSYTEIILDYFQDPELKLLLSEDFSQYSLQYATKDLKLPNTCDMLTGVSDSNKEIKQDINSTLQTKEADTSIVFVRNCENKNWIKTKPPKICEVSKILAEGDSDKDSDHGYDSNAENVVTGNLDDKITEKNVETEDDQTLEEIDEEKSGVNIFDDIFDDIDERKAFNELQAEADMLELNNESLREFENSRINLQDLEDDKNTIQDSKSDIHDTISETHTNNVFNPTTFDREKTIKELILVACEKYKIPIPPQYSDRESRKRKPPLIQSEAGCSEHKKIKINNPTGAECAKKEMERILTTYYSTLHKDVLNELSEHLQAVINDIDGQDLDEEGAHVDENGSTLVLGDTSQDKNLETNDADLGFENRDLSENDKDPSEDSVIETNVEDATDVGDLLPKTNPNFDDKTHDTRQLYVKFKDKFDFDDLDFDDPEIDKIIAKKIEEFKKKGLFNNDGDVASEKESEDSQLEDENVEVIIETFRQKKEAKRRWEKFVTAKVEVKEFNYWQRQYRTAWMRRMLNIIKKFDLELKENLPKSFCFVIEECASVLNCSNYMLYKCMQNLELLLI